MKRIASFFLALALAFSLTACTVPVEKADDGKIQIVATLFPTTTLPAPSRAAART